MTIRVLLADDHAVVRQGVRAVLSAYPDLEVVGEAGDGDGVLALAGELQPDVLLLDVRMPGRKVIEVVRELQVRQPSLHVLMLSACGDDGCIVGMLRAGASGYLLKDEEPAGIAEGVRAVAQGRRWLSAGVTESLAGRLSQDTARPADGLGGREREVLALLAQGRSNVEIANRLWLAEATVKNHVSHVYAKLGVATRAEAVAWAWREGLVGGDGTPAGAE